jgi:2-polyprenyl-3-methyl-5-hydroxy-6-metoxy-1,4-benzoquinol methylase
MGLGNTPAKCGNNRLWIDMPICNICHSDSCEEAFTACNVHGRHVLNANERFDYHRCTNCGNVFLHGVKVDGDFYRKNYADDYYGKQLPSNSCIERLANTLARCSNRAKTQTILKHVRKATARINLLDIGCGGGDFLHELPQDTFEGCGVDVNEKAVAICRQKGLRAYGGDIRHMRLAAAPFDVITLWHVIEHEADPVSFLARIKEIKKPEGVVVFSVPNTDSLGFRLGRGNWFHTDAPRHLFLPNTRSIETLLTLAGLTLRSVSCWHFEFPLDLFWSIRKTREAFFLIPMYPVCKLYSRETLTFVAV